jgi:hypothetical protein
MRALSGAVGALTALTLAACGSAGSSSAPSPTAAPGPAAAASVPAQTSAASSTETATTRPPRCQAAGLTLKFLGQQGATGHGELGFALRNTGAGSCRTFGYPGVLFLDQAGNPLPTQSTRTTHDFFGTTVASPLVVAPGESVSFRLGVSHGAASSSGCVTAHALQVIPPDDTGTLRAAIPQGAYECGGQVTVSPLQRGTSAYP